MGKLRALRRNVNAISDDEEDAGSEALPSDPSEDEHSVVPQNRGTGKLKPVKKAPKKSLSTPSPSTQKSSSQKSPAKSKASKAKGKAAAKDQAKANGKPIYSFFNAATQEQQLSQSSPRAEKLTAPRVELEAIEDDIGDGDASDVHLATGSSTALALRKRKVQHSDSLEHDSGGSSLSQHASQKFRKVGSGERVPALAIINEDKRPWTEQFAPKDLSELAVHKKKVADVRQWLEMTFNGRRQRVLVLKGAAGTGKTTTIHLLAQDMGTRVMEWRNPAGGDVTSESSASTAAQFAEFIGRAGRSGGLRLAASIDNESDALYSTTDAIEPSDENKSLLLIEEFPNTFSRSSGTLQAFRSAIMQYLASPTLIDGAIPTPIVMIISETLLSTNTALSDSFTAHRLLGPELANHPYLDMIEFNAVAPTYLTKALETIVLKEARKSGRRRTPGPQVLKHLAETGDVRSAVSSLEFLCLRSDDDETWSGKVAFGKQKKAKNDAPLSASEQEALKLISNRESTLGIFHAVGKVVYNKRIDAQSIAHPPPWFPQYRRNKIPENDLDEMINELGTDTSTFIAALHENYVLSCGSAGNEETLDSLSGCISSISDADLLSADRFSFGTRAYSGSATDNLRQDEMAFQVVVRGMLFDLPYPVHRSTINEVKRGDAHKMFYPASLKLWKKREEMEGILELLTTKFQAGSLTASIKSTGNSGAKGVESWKQNSSAQLQATEHDSQDMSSTITSGVKTEMLLERLPYIAQITPPRSLPGNVFDRIVTVTRVRGATVQVDDETEMDETDESVAEQWATDKPEGEAGVQSPVKKRQSKQGITVKEESGLPSAVESSIEKLVLADDDIVDDFS